LPKRIRLKPRFVNGLRSLAHGSEWPPWPNMGIPVPRPDTPHLPHNRASTPDAPYNDTSNSRLCSLMCLLAKLLRSVRALTNRTKAAAWPAENDSVRRRTSRMENRTRGRRRNALPRRKGREALRWRARQNGPPLAIDTFGGQRISMDDLTGRSRLRCKVIAIGDTTKPL
jgi:hypothetical protein